VYDWLFHSDRVAGELNPWEFVSLPMHHHGSVVTSTYILVQVQAYVRQHAPRDAKENYLVVGIWGGGGVEKDSNPCKSLRNILKSKILLNVRILLTGGTESFSNRESFSTLEAFEPMEAFKFRESFFWFRSLLSPLQLPLQ
jgi:hypothetical protein